MKERNCKPSTDF